MKKRQKIIVVISCLAVIVSVLAVNCFAWTGSSDLDFIDRSALLSVSAHLDNVTDETFGVPINNIVYLPNNGFYRGDGTVNQSSSLKIPLDSAGRVEAYFQYKMAGSASTHYKNYIDWQTSKYYLDGERTLTNVSVNDVHLEYGYFRVLDAPDDNVTFGRGSSSQDVRVSCFVVVPVSYVYTSGDYTKLVTQNCVVEVSGSAPYHANLKYFKEDLQSVAYSAKRYNPIQDNYTNDMYVIEDVSLFESLEDYIANDLFAPQEYSVVDVDMESAYVKYGDVRYSSPCTGVAVNSYTCINEEFRGADTVVTNDVEVTVEEVIEEIHYDEVEPFEWIVQAVDGVLDTELFGSITIGHLILCAIAIPCLLAILRAIAGG